MARTVTLSSLRSQVRQRADMVNSTFVSDAEVNQYINNSVAELYDILIQKFGNEYNITSSNITTVAGTDTYNLPSDFYKLVGVDLLVSGTDYVSLLPFMFIERNRWNGTTARTAFGVSGLRYHLIGSTVRFVPMPDAAQTIKLWYIPYISELGNDAATLDGVNGYEEYVIIDAAIKCLQKEESDVTVLALQKQAMLQRIESAAENRDAGMGDRVSDVRRTDYERLSTWYV